MFLLIEKRPVILFGDFELCFHIPTTSSVSSFSSTTMAAMIVAINRRAYMRAVILENMVCRDGARRVVLRFMSVSTESINPAFYTEGKNPAALYG